MQKFLEPGFQFIERFLRSEIPTRAAALAFHTIFAIVPAVGLIFLYLNSIGITEQWMGLLRGYILSHLNVNAGSLFMENFEKITLSVRGTTGGWIGVILLAYTSWSLITKFGNSMDILLKMRPEEPKPTFSFFVLFLRRLFVIFGLPLSLCVTLVVTQWVREDSWVQKILHWETAGPLMAVPMAWVIDIFALFLIYLLVPKRAILKGQALRAALCTAPILELSRFGVGKFNSYCVSVHKVYGVLAAIPMVLLWIEVAWMVVLSGTLLISHTKQPSENA